MGRTYECLLSSNASVYKMRLAEGDDNFLTQLSVKIQESGGYTYDTSTYLREESVDAVADIRLTNETAHHLINVGFQTQMFTLFLYLHNAK
jgi:hypothetical protein